MGDQDLRPQVNRWTCGPAALRNAMSAYNYAPTIRGLASSAGTTPEDGTDVPGLRRAAVEHGFWLGELRARTAAEAFDIVLPLARQRVPVLACVDHYQHWVVLMRGNSRHVWVADSARDGDEVLRRRTWRQFLSRVAFGLEDEARCFLYPLTVLD